jgi:hypothetical protein
MNTAVERREGVSYQFIEFTKAGVRETTGVRSMNVVMATRRRPSARCCAGGAAHGQRSSRSGTGPGHAASSCCAGLATRWPGCAPSRRSGPVRGRSHGRPRVGRADLRSVYRLDTVAENAVYARILDQLSEPGPVPDDSRLTALWLGQTGYRKGLDVALALAAVAESPLPAAAPAADRRRGSRRGSGRGSGVVRRSLSRPGDRALTARGPAGLG